MKNNIADSFASGLSQLNLSLEPAAQNKLLQFLKLLQKWNQHYNLTAITDLPKMVSHHLLDSLSIAPFIQGTKILDLGSGAGFPGIPLAVFFPQKQWTLLDSNGKKTRFLTQAKVELQLDNVEVVQARIGQWQTAQKFDAIVVRAVGSIHEIIAKTQHLLTGGGCWLFMKGDYEHEELETLQPPPIIHTLSVPEVLTPRYLIAVSVEVKKQNSGFEV